MSNHVCRSLLAGALLTLLCACVPGGGGTNPAVATGPLAPVASNDSFSVDPGSNEMLPVLANDSANASGELVIVSVTQPSNGGATEINGNAVNYSPPVGVSNSSETFSYTIKNSDELTDSASVSVNINAAVPTAVDDDATVAANSGDSVIDVRANDSANTGGDLTVVSVGQPSKGGTASHDGGSVRYRPPSNVSNTSEFFSYTIENIDGGRDSASVTISIDPAIPTASDDAATVAPDSVDNAISVLDNDGANTSGSLTIIGVSDPPSGSATINNGSTISYSPDAGVSNVVDSFSYTIENADAQQAMATVTVNITANVGSIPDAVDDTFDVDPNASAADFDVLGNDASNAAGGLTIVAVSTPTQGGTAAINAGFINYQPASGTSGIDEIFNYTVENSDGFRDSATVTMTILSNAPPIPMADSLAIKKNSPRNTVDVVANDEDADDDPLTIVVVEPPDAGGRAWIENNKIVYEPTVNFVGVETVSYSVSDGINTPVTGTMTATISDFTEDQTQLRPCEVEQEARKAAGRPYCFDVLIPSFDEHTIAATVFVPADEGASKPPVVLHAHGFGESRFASLENPNFVMGFRVTAQSLVELWHEGFWVVTFDQRGFNASGIWGNSADSANDPCTEQQHYGCIDVMSPEREGRDVTVVIDWIVDNLRDGFVADEDGEGITAPPNGLAADALFAEDEAGDPALGSIGLSYGGGWQTIGSSVETELNGTRFGPRTADSRIDAMVPVTTWYDLRYSLSANDVPKSGWLQFLTAATQAGGTALRPPPNGFLAQAGQEALVADNVSKATYDGLYVRSVRSYCDNVGDDDILDTDDADPIPEFGNGGIPGVANAADSGPDVFLIQGQRDMLFNYNEAVDLANCYAQNTGADVRLLIETEGHILASAQPASYKDQNSGGEPQIIYIDEEVPCDDTGALLMTRKLIAGWFRDKLNWTPRVGEAVIEPTNASSIPRVCTTHFRTGASPVTGTSFNSLADIPVGGSTHFNLLEQQFFVPGDQQDPNSTDPANLVVDIPVFTASSDAAISGIPTANFTITANGAPGGDPPRFFVGFGVRRGGTAPSQLLADQVTPISGFVPNPATDCDFSGCNIAYTYPRSDAENNLEHGELVGRLAGFAAKLAAGDRLMLLIYAQHPLYNLHSTNPGGYQITLNGSLALPILP